MDYLRYYVPVLVQLAAYVGFVLGGNWVFIGIASLPIVKRRSKGTPYRRRRGTPFSDMMLVS